MQSALPTGTRIGVYEVTAQIGVGGMGEVYRATDTKLKRQVAIKVLPPTLAGDLDRLARFQREAEVLASLNHPNIAGIYGLEESGGVKALVMELVEGPTLADVIAGVPASGTGGPHARPATERGLSEEDALGIARQIAAALEAAHEHGIVHRDLKPANIKLRPDGTVKVLDFGLAKAMEPARGISSSVSLSPTITSPTQAGMILGTAAYMSPEQARGRAVDKRADIWAFGCVLFELLTGERAFKGEDVSETLAAVIRADPDLDAAPEGVRRLLKSCLEKDPKRRLRDIGDIGLLLDHPPQTVVAPPAQVPARSRWLWPSVAAALLVISSGLAWFTFTRATPDPVNLRFQIATPGTAPAQMFTLSGDGSLLAFVAADGGTNRIWVRTMDTLEARALAGTDGATYPFWSPDGRWLGFFAQGKLRKIAIAGGPAQTIHDALSGRGGSWSREGTIVFSPSPTSPIVRVSAAGGEATPITQLAGPAGHRFPSFLPDGRHFLFAAGSDDPAAVGLFIGSLDGTAPVRLVPDLSNGLYAAPVGSRTSGFVLFRRDESTLMALPFDASRLRSTGEAFPVAEGIAQGSSNAGFGAFTIASNGALLYRTGGPASRQLWWVDRAGTRLNAVTKPVPILDRFRLSPDGRTVAMRLSAGSGTSELWLQQLESDALARFTFSNKSSRNPVWSPDGGRVVFAILDTSQYSSVLHQKATTGNASDELLRPVGVNAIPTDWSRDGNFLLYQQQDPKTFLDLWLLPMDGDRKPVPYLQTPTNELNGSFFPGHEGPPRFVAYQSDEGGRAEIFVQSVPAGVKFQVSSGGGTLPQWRPDGRELYYASPDRRLMAASVTAGASLQIGTPTALFELAVDSHYVPSADGQKFLVSLPEVGGSAAGPQPLTVVTNWQAGVGR